MKRKAIITKGDIKLNVAGIEYPNTAKGFADAFKKNKDVKFTSKSTALHGKESLIISGKKEVLLDVKTNTTNSK